MVSVRLVHRLILVLSLTSITGLRAVTRDWQAALELRQRTEIPEGMFAAEPASVVKLPISRNFMQGGSRLCWVYALLSALETTHLVSEPGQPLELSRHFLQYETMADRWKRKVHGGETFIEEGGTPVDGIQLIRSTGMAQFKDYADTTIVATYEDWDKKIMSEPSVTLQLKKLIQVLSSNFGALPTETSWQGTKFSTKAFGERLVQGAPWVAYAPLTRGTEGWSTHPDAGARKGTLAYFMVRTRISAKIRYSLLHGSPVLYGNGPHDNLIYGAEYDENGKALLYYVKDSAVGNYRAEAGRYEAEMNNVTIRSVP